MHLQIKSVVVAGSGGTGARNADEGSEGITIARPGRLLRLLDILAEDRSEGDHALGFSLTRAGGKAIETGASSSSPSTRRRPRTTRTTRRRSTGSSRSSRRAGSSR